MQKFLNQFNLRLVMALGLEQFIFSLSDNMVEGYAGGVFTDKEVDGVTIFMLPEATSYNIRASFSGVHTDHLTASAAITMLAINWFWNKYTDRLTDAENEAFHNYYYKLRDMVWSDDATHNINRSDFFNITD